jgi:hypothetical protein
VLEFVPFPQSVRTPDFNDRVGLAPSETHLNFIRHPEGTFLMVAPV